MKLIDKINKATQIVLMPVKNNYLFFIFMYLLGVITVFIEVVVLGFKIPRFNFLSLIMDIYILCLLLTMIPKRFRGFFRFLFSLSAYVLAIINAFCVEHFYARIGLEILNVVLETNLRESTEFIDKYINIGVLWSSVGVIILLMLIHIYCVRSEKKRYHFPLHGLCNMANVLFFLLLFVSFYFCLNSRIKIVKLMMASTAEEVDGLVSNYSQNTPFNNLLFSIKMRMISNEGFDVLAETQDRVKIDGCLYSSKKIVLIIGESYIKDHSQLYGYDKYTTPLQMARTELSDQGCLVPFTDVVSPSNLTSIVFKDAFSLCSLDEKSEWSRSPLFPVLYRLAGYKVFFLTNQFVQALGTDIFNVSGGLFLNHKKLSRAQFDYRNTKTHRYDMDLLEDYDSLKLFESDYSLVIFHLAGQHIDFSKRCPGEFRKFDKSDYLERSDLDDSEKQLVADYDNATYYNDIVVDSIIKKYANDDAIIIYMPDHGEECFDELHRMGRLPSNYYTPEVLRQEYRIPFWIWCSKKYIDSHQEIFNQINESRAKPFMTDDLPHLMLYLAGISCEYYNETRNILSPNFNTKRKRMVNGKCNYDELVK